MRALGFSPDLLLCKCTQVPKENSDISGISIANWKWLSKVKIQLPNLDCKKMVGTSSSRQTVKCSKLSGYNLRHVYTHWKYFVSSIRSVWHFEEAVEQPLPQLDRSEAVAGHPVFLSQNPFPLHTPDVCFLSLLPTFFWKNEAVCYLWGTHKCQKKCLCPSVCGSVHTGIPAADSNPLSSLQRKQPGWLNSTPRVTTGLQRKQQSQAQTHTHTLCLHTLAIRSHRITYSFLCCISPPLSVSVHHFTNIFSFSPIIPPVHHGLWTFVQRLGMRTGKIGADAER